MVGESFLYFLYIFYITTKRRILISTVKPDAISCSPMQLLVTPCEMLYVNVPPVSSLNDLACLACSVVD